MKKNQKKRQNKQNFKFNWENKKLKNINELEKKSIFIPDEKEIINLLLNQPLCI